MTSLLSFVSIVALGVTATLGAPQGSLVFRPTQYQNVLSSDSNDGRYIHDTSGDYYPDQSGSYQHDNSGDYVPDDNPYLHQAGGSGSDYSGSGGVGGSGGFGGSGSTIVVGTGLRGSSGSSTPSGASLGISSGVYGANKVSGIPAAAGYGQAASLKQGNAAGLYDNKNYAIIRKIEVVEPESYNYLYETENGIYAEEQGHLVNKGSENEAINAKGYFTYTGPDNVVYTVQYTADENGFVPQGAHLPTPPPIPEAILRSLEYQKSIGEL
ncbi:larval cuticle protein LCP-30-like [Anoplophora glabripennis]|uniref:larval cuticle protein LCP-30-like n=1 Tax=Anoplophora glabripennis TaxID=217634 RepID=UPI0008738171|nr:larval cuticle protein LCP-30-like [Anoplophora glabripennis]